MTASDHWPAGFARAAHSCPERLGLAQSLLGIDAIGRRQMGFAVAQNERNGLTRRHGERPHGLEVDALQGDGRPQHGHVRTGDGAQRTVREACHPGGQRAVVESEHQLGAHLQAAALAVHEPHDIGTLAARRHEIDDCDGAVRRLEFGLQDQGPIAVAAGDARVRVGGGQQPAAIIIARTEQRGEARGAVEARPAQPIDGAVTADQRAPFRNRR